MLKKIRGWFQVKIIDLYIIRKYFISMLGVLGILIPIAVTIDISEKIDKFIHHTELTTTKIINDHYLNFVLIYCNTFLPLVIFIAIIFFTSRLSNNTEIVAIQSSKISLNRFLVPYFKAATITTIFALFMNHQIVPNANKVFEKFNRDYLLPRKYLVNTISDLNLQISPNEYIYYDTYYSLNEVGYNFTYERFEGIQLKFKLYSNNIKFNKEDSTYVLSNYYKRYFLKGKDSIEYGTKMDTVFNYLPKDLITLKYMEKEMTTKELKEYIDTSEKRGVKELNLYKVELYKRTSLPLATYILTFLAVIVAYKKRRGGIGLNLAIGISLMFVYVFLLKIVEVLGSAAGKNPLLYVWSPNVLFGLLSIYLYYRNGKK